MTNILIWMLMNIILQIRYLRVPQHTVWIHAGNTAATVFFCKSVYMVKALAALHLGRCATSGMVAYIEQWFGGLVSEKAAVVNAALCCFHGVSLWFVDKWGMRTTYLMVLTLLNIFILISNYWCVSASVLKLNILLLSGHPSSLQ